MYKIGTSKTDITAFKKGAGMLGYGLYFNTMESIGSRLFARAFIIEQNNKKVALVNCELCFITIALKKGVVEKVNLKHPGININEQNLMLTAQHTHSGPGGYDHHTLYNASIPGFITEIYEALTDKIALAIVEANNNLQEDCSIEFGEAPFDEDTPVAFNRSINAYNKNKDVQALPFEKRHLAVDRNMYLLSFKDKEGHPLGSINWFGVHTTSISNDNNKINSDNKGYAAQFLEDSYVQKGKENYVGAFAQGVCGDISPKFNYNKAKTAQRGKWDGVSSDDYESAKTNGRFQYEQAEKIIADTSVKVNSGINFKFNYFNVANVKIDPEFSNGTKNAKTNHAALGVSFLEGSPTDGPAMPKPLGWIARRASSIYYNIDLLKSHLKDKTYKEKFSTFKEAQGNKHSIIGAGTKTIYYGNISRLLVPGFLDPSIESLRYFYKKKALGKDKPWINEILPVQIIQIGQIAIVGIPAEITTVAGKRMHTSIKQQLANMGIEKVILSPYANTYAGYITTFEEYQTQHYEGGHTLFGKWTLGAFQTVFKQLIKNWDNPNENENIVPVSFTPEEIERGKFYIRPWYKKKLQKKKRKKNK